IEVAGKRKTSKKVKVNDGFGTRVLPKKDPEPPRPLPPAPSWQEGPTSFVALGATGTLRGAWTPVAEAARYRIELAEDARGAAVVQVVDLPETTRAFELREVPPGRYWVHVASVDA